MRAKNDSLLGKYATRMRNQPKPAAAVKKQNYSMSLLAAITQTEVLSCQMLEGGVDSTVFENFVYRTLYSIRTNPETRDKHVMVFMDNAVIHKHS